LTFDSYEGYELQFVQQRNCNDSTAHLFTLIYKFRSPVTRMTYIIHADYHEEELFNIKFYPKCYRKSAYRYNRITNKGDFGNILVSCTRLIPLLLADYPCASFGFIGARTIEKYSAGSEPAGNTQRFKAYKYFISKKIGNKTFEHFEYPVISAYLLVNKKHNVEHRERAIVKMFLATYSSEALL